jgi:hypothetical protein
MAQAPLLVETLVKKLKHTQPLQNTGDPEKGSRLSI